MQELNFEYQLYFLMEKLHNLGVCGASFMKHYVCIQGVCPKMYTFLIANISTFKMYYKKCHIVII